MTQIIRDEKRRIFREIIHRIVISIKFGAFLQGFQNLVGMLYVNEIKLK
jgi:hypothetical protein